jgi:hypothetical protein
LAFSFASVGNFLIYYVAKHFTKQRQQWILLYMLPIQILSGGEVLWFFVAMYLGSLIQKHGVKVVDETKPPTLRMGGSNHTSGR